MSYFKIKESDCNFENARLASVVTSEQRVTRRGEVSGSKGGQTVRKRYENKYN